MRTGKEKVVYPNELYGGHGIEKTEVRRQNVFKWFLVAPAFVGNWCQGHIDARLRYIKKGYVGTLNCGWPSRRLSSIYNWTF